MRDAFHYCLCLLMVEAGKMRLVEKVPGEICVFETTVGERFSAVESAINKQQELALIGVFGGVLEESK